MSTKPSLKKKEPIDWFILISVIIFIVLAIFIVIAVINKEEERIRLRARLKILSTRKYQVQILKESLDTYFKYAYNLIKMVSFSFLAVGLFLIYESLPEKNIFEFAARFTDLAGAISLIILLICLFIEENPICIFTMRSKIKSLLEKAIYEPHIDAIQQMPIISAEIEKIKKTLD